MGRRVLVRAPRCILFEPTQVSRCRHCRCRWRHRRRASAMDERQHLSLLPVADEQQCHDLRGQDVQNFSKWNERGSCPDKPFWLDRSERCPASSSGIHPIPKSRNGAEESWEDVCPLLVNGQRLSRRSGYKPVQEPVESIGCGSFGSACHSAWRRRGTAEEGDSVRPSRGLPRIDNPQSDDNPCNDSVQELDVRD